MNFKSIFSVLMLSAGLSLNSFADAANDESKINVPTTVTVEDIATEWDMPRSMRTGNNSKTGVNTLAIEGFDMKAGSAGHFNLSLNLPATVTTYVRIVDAAGYDVYFETLRDNASFSKQLDLSSLSAGTYYLQVTQKGKTFNKRLIFN